MSAQEEIRTALWILAKVEPKRPIDRDRIELATAHVRAALWKLERPREATDGEWTCTGFQAGGPNGLACELCGAPEAVHRHDCKDYRGGGGPDGKFCLNCGKSRIYHDPAQSRPKVVMPPGPGTVWKFGFPGRGTPTVWKCQGCGRLHEPNPPRCLVCAHTVLDPGHWAAVPTTGATT